MNVSQVLAVTSPLVGPIYHTTETTATRSK